MIIGEFKSLDGGVFSDSLSQTFLLYTFNYKNQILFHQTNVQVNTLLINNS